MINKVILMGRLTADPELRTTQSGTSVCSFCIAVNRQYSKDKEAQADFIDIVAWRQTAEFVTKYFSKGRMIIVEGAVQTCMFEDKGGNKHKAVEVVASNVQFGESKAAAQANTSAQYGALQGAVSGQYTQPIQRQTSPPQQPVAYASGSFNNYDEMGDSEDLPF